MFQRRCVGADEDVLLVDDTHARIDVRKAQGAALASKAIVDDVGRDGADEDVRREIDAHARVDVRRAREAALEDYVVGLADARARIGVGEALQRTDRCLERRGRIASASESAKRHAALAGQERGAGGERLTSRW